MYNFFFFHSVFDKFKSTCYIVVDSCFIFLRSPQSIGINRKTLKHCYNAITLHLGIIHTWLWLRPIICNCCWSITLICSIWSECAGVVSSWRCFTFEIELERNSFKSIAQIKRCDFANGNHQSSHRIIYMNRHHNLNKQTSNIQTNHCTRWFTHNTKTAEEKKHNRKITKSNEWFTLKLTNHSYRRSTFKTYRCVATR